MDYESLKLIWWALIAVLLIGFAVADGFDMGAVALLRIAGHTDNERRVILNTVGPHWDGNQVWLITAAGAVFAAWPVLYAVSFSGLYWALLFLLFALFFRPVGFEYRSKIETPRWRNNWDWLMTFSSTVPPIIFGVAFGNLFLGLPFTLDEYMRSYYEGSFWQLLHPFALISGVVSLAMLMMQGGAYLLMRTEGDLHARLRRITRLAAMVAGGAFILAGICLVFIDGYAVTQMPDANLNMTPLQKQVELVSGGWLSNYGNYPLTILAPLLALASLFMTVRWIDEDKNGLSFVSSSLAVAAIITTAGCSLFPFVMPSSIDPNLSLTLWDAASSQKTLGIMALVAAVFVPVILMYTFWGYYKMWGRLSTRFIEDNKYGVY